MEQCIDCIAVIRMQGSHKLKCDMYHNCSEMHQGLGGKKESTKL